MEDCLRVCKRELVECSGWYAKLMESLVEQLKRGLKDLFKERSDSSLIITLSIVTTLFVLFLPLALFIAAYKMRVEGLGFVDAFMGYSKDCKERYELCTDSCLFGKPLEPRTSVRRTKRVERRLVGTLGSPLHVNRIKEIGCQRNLSLNAYFQGHELELPLEDCCLLGSGTSGVVLGCGNYAVKMSHRTFNELIIGASSEYGSLKIVGGGSKWVLDTLMKIDHPHLIKVIDYSSEPTIIVMERAEATLIEGSLNEEEAKLFLFQTLDALRTLHSLSLIHGDVKPSNVFMKDGVVKLGDYSALRSALFGEFAESFATECTEPYCPPEYFEYRTLNEKSDLYMLANTTLELLGIEPLNGRNWSQGALETRLARVKDPELREVLRAMLQRDPLERPDPLTLIAL